MPILRNIVARQSKLRTQIDAIVADLERGAVMSKIDELIKEYCPNGVVFKELREISVSHKNWL